LPRWRWSAANPPAQTRLPHTELENRGQTSLQQFLSHDPGLQNNINNAAGYVVFPEIGKGAVGVGGASGLGTVYKGNQVVGTVKLQQVSVGPQIGGETYGELIIFENEAALNRLMNNSFEFGATAQAIVVKAGAAAAARFDNGTEAYILPKGGLLAGADLHGQKFKFYPNGVNANDDMTTQTQNDTTYKRTDTTVNSDGTVQRDTTVQKDVH
jgi:lipid-binding SYLF domain-containing protein